MVLQQIQRRGNCQTPRKSYKTTRIAAKLWVDKLGPIPLPSQQLLRLIIHFHLFFIHPTAVSRDFREAVSISRSSLSVGAQFHSGWEALAVACRPRPE